MNPKDKKTLISLIIFICIIFYYNGFIGVIQFIKRLTNHFWIILKTLNIITVKYTGDSILTLIFSSIITFVIIGVIFDYFNIPKGTFGKIFGKFSFWLIGIPISFIFNFIGKLIF